MSFWNKTSPAAAGVVLPSVKITSTENQPSADTKWIEVEGYKGLNPDMTGYGGFQYELGKTYYADGDIEECKNGFHFCLQLTHIPAYGYRWQEKTRYFKVKALVREEDYLGYGQYGIKLGTLIVVTKLVAKEITLIEELALDEVYNALEPDISQDAFVRFYRSNMEFKDFLREEFQSSLQGKYSDTFIMVLFDKAAQDVDDGTQLAVLNGYNMTTIDKDKDLCISLNHIYKKAIALYEEGVSTDVRAYLLLK